jgi:hypothetical protein
MSGHIQAPTFAPNPTSNPTLKPSSNRTLSKNILIQPQLEVLGVHDSLYYGKRDDYICAFVVTLFEEFFEGTVFF